MMRALFSIAADTHNKNSIVSRIRKRRFSYLAYLIERVIRESKEPIKILDIGGRVKFWEDLPFEEELCSVHIINLEEGDSSNRSNITCSKGDARKMPEFGDGQFDIVVSNSVIEHVGTWQDQYDMAMEVERVGGAIFIQTPNYWFPMEPHFLMPFFQFLPIWFRTWLVSNFDMGNYKKTKNWDEARSEVVQVRLLTRRGFRGLFREGTIQNEWLFGLINGFIITNGWPEGSLSYKRFSKDFRGNKSEGA